MNKSYFQYLLKSKKTAWCFYAVIYLAFSLVQYIGKSYSSITSCYMASFVAMGILSGIATFVLPIFLFSFIHRKSSCDMFLSIPVNRKEILITTLVFCFLVAYVPFVTVSFAEYILLCAKTIGFVEYLRCVLFFGFGLLVMLLVNTACYVCANNILDGLIMVCAYTFLPLVLVLLEESVLNMYSVNNWGYAAAPKAIYLSPAAMFTIGMGKLTSNLPNTIVYYSLWGDYKFAYVFAGMLLFGILAVIVLKKQFINRKAERAEQVSNDIMAYPFIINIFLLACLILLSVSCVSDGSYSEMLILYVLLFVVYILATCIYRRKIKVSVKNVIYFVICSLFTIGIAQFAWVNKGFGIAYKYSLTEGETLEYYYYGSFEDGKSDKYNYKNINFELPVPTDEIEQYTEVIELLEEKRTEAIDRYFEIHADYYYEDSSGNLSVRSLGKKDEVIHGYGYFLSDGFTVSELKTINKYCVVSIDCTDSDYVSTTYTLDEYLKEVK